MITSIQNVLQKAVEHGVAPGFAAAVGLIHHPIQFRCTAGTEANTHSNPVSFNTVYDLASLTKVLCTTILCARAIVDKKVSLDESAWPMWPGVTIRNVLNHTAGLGAWKALYDTQGDWKSSIELQHAPGEKTIYSDLGFIALGELLAQRYARPLDALFYEATNHVYSSDLFFLSHQHSSFPTSIAPTGYCPYRQRMIHGEVHDANAAYLGGIAGHAGLFGNVYAVENAVRYLTKAITAPSNELEKVLQEFAQAKGERPLGFDNATPQGATGGCLSPATVGHLGFTGTSFFIDPKQQGGAYYILLSNRTFAQQDAKAMLHVRQEFHRTAMQMLNSCEI